MESTIYTFRLAKHQELVIRSTRMFNYKHPSLIIRAKTKSRNANTGKKININKTKVN